MKKKILMLLLTGVMLMQCLPFNCFSEGALPSDATEIEFDKQYWLEGGEVAWHRFIAPAPYCYLTDMPLENIDGYVLGWPVEGNTCYDKNGKSIGPLSSGNDPETGGWSELTAGEEYFLKIEAPKGGVHYTLSAVKESFPEKAPSRKSNVTSRSITLKEEGRSEFVPGEYNTLWDIYTVSEGFSAGEENVITSSTFFITPYRIYFENSVLTAKGKVTYNSIERSCAQAADELEKYVAIDAEVKNGEYIQAANHYSYVLDPKGEATREFDVWVPSGKTLILSDAGYFTAAGVDSLYSDVAAKSWYSDAVLYATEHRLMQGTGKGKFAPSTNFTRAQMVQVLANIDGVDLSEYKDMNSFSDVKKGSWYAPAVEWANALGITKGTGNGKFSPTKNVTREQIAVFLCSYARLKGAELSGKADLSGYSDAKKISSWATADFELAVALGIINGTSETKLSPSGVATRAQIAVMLNRFNENILAPLAPSTHKGRYFLSGDTCGFASHYEIVELSGKEKPNVLFIGMASTDPAEGYGAVQHEYGLELGCTTDYLSLEDLENGAAEEKIMKADIINVGSGDSRMMLARLRKHNTDELLRRAAEKGTVMCGSSAGAICFGVYGTSGIGYERFEDLKATGCVDLIICPHGTEKTRVEKAKADLMKDPTLTAIVLGNSALEIKDGMFRIYAEGEFLEYVKKQAVGTKYWVENGELRSQELYSDTLEWRPLSDLGL